MKNILKNTMHKYFLKILSSIIIIASISSCTDKFEEYNRNPGEPTLDDLAVAHYLVKVYFPNLFNYAYPVQENAYQLTENFVGGVYGRYFSISNATWKNHFQTFNSADKWLYTPMEDGYKYVVRYFYEVKQLAEGREQYQHLYNLAKILKITNFHRITDMYGPLPYTKFTLGEEVDYDDQETIYKAMFEELDEAINYLTEYYKENPDYGQKATLKDPIYANDYKKWVIYANTLKLRMAMRVRFANPVLAQEKAESAVKHEWGVMNSNEDNAYNSFTPNGLYKVGVEWSDTRACADIVCYMNGYGDPRLGKYFTELNPEDPWYKIYVGIRSGIDIASQEIARKYSAPRALTSDPLLIMPASESYFLRAEGAILGWDMGGTAQNFYEEGIKTSMKQWNVEEYYINEYVYNASRKPSDYEQPSGKLLIEEGVNYSVKNASTATIQWNESADEETKLEKIITQKWIALYPLGQEGWSEQRRTGYPKFFPVLVNLSDDATLTEDLASRIPYPSIEKNKGGIYNKALQLLGGPDKYSTKLWWDQNPNKNK